MREVERAELRVLQQGVEQRVHGRQHVEGAFLEHLDELGNVARVGDQRQARTLADGQQAQREREDGYSGSAAMLLALLRSPILPAPG